MQCTLSKTYPRGNLIDAHRVDNEAEWLAQARRRGAGDGAGAAAVAAAAVRWLGGWGDTRQMRMQVNGIYLAFPAMSRGIEPPGSSLLWDKP